MLGSQSRIWSSKLASLRAFPEVCGLRLVSWSFETRDVIIQSCWVGRTRPQILQRWASGVGSVFFGVDRQS